VAITIDALLNDFAVRCFRDIADADYITARMAFRASLTTQYLWATQQAMEKYLKGILLLYRIPATEVFHDLEAALSKIDKSGKLALDLTAGTKKFIRYIDSYGRFRYLETSPFVFGDDIVRLDRAIWEIRRYCTLSEHGREVKLTDGEPAPIVRIEGGYLETIVDTAKHPARGSLLWQNGFFGRRRRRTVRLKGGFHATNSPLFLNPHILDEVLEYVFLPKDVRAACRRLRDEGGPRLKPKT
jgi:HEPN domain-containing protein